MQILVQVEVELRLEDSQASQKQEIELHKATVEQTDQVVQKARVLEGSVTQTEVQHHLLLALSKRHHAPKCPVLHGEAGGGDHSATSVLRMNHAQARTGCACKTSFNSRAFVQFLGGLRSQITN